MENNLENLTIGVLARMATVNVETIRFYQRKGLLPQPDRPYGSIRRYEEVDVARVRFIKSAQRLGFSLNRALPAHYRAAHRVNDIDCVPATKCRRVLGV